MNLKEWIFTTDHKRVGVLYLIGSILAFAIAGVMALLMRAEPRSGQALGPAPPGRVLSRPCSRPAERLP